MDLDSPNISFLNSSESSLYSIDSDGEIYKKKTLHQLLNQHQVIIGQMNRLPEQLWDIQKELISRNKEYLQLVQP